MDPKKASEKVLVVPRKTLFERLDYFQGFLAAEPALDWSLVTAGAEFRTRGEVEEAPEWQQLIPYVTVFSTDGRLFVFRRSRSGGEARLFNRCSIGIGGHINPADSALDPIAAGLEREFHEELESDAAPDFEFMGYLNGDELPVDRVHFGLVFKAVLGSDQVRVRETEMMSGEFTPPQRALELEPEMEGWSRMLLPAALRALGREA